MAFHGAGAFWSFGIELQVVEVVTPKKLAANAAANFFLESWVFGTF
jgi:hypothetical protein